MMAGRIKIMLVLSCLLLSFAAWAQQDKEMVLLPYTETNITQLYNSAGIHTAWKQQLYEDTGYARGRGSWLRRKLLDEHLLFFEKDGFHISADFIPDFQLGNSSRASKTPWTNTRAARISGNFGPKVYFEMEDFVNQARFPGYVDSYIRRTGVIPGSQTFRRNSNTAPYDFNHASGKLVYMPDTMFRFELGYGKNFIGDGRRSLLLSDWAFNYPYLKATVNYRSLQYTVMWSQYISGLSNTFYYSGYPRKWGQTFFLDWLFTKDGSIGLFESVIWPDQDNNNRKDLSWTMASPVMFLHGSKSPSGTVNSTLTGLNARYRVYKNTHVYGQVAVSDMLRSKHWQNRLAMQLGIRSFAPFGVDGLSLQAEFNRADPYTYAGNSRQVNYAHYNQSLAHPFGANLKEGLLIAAYRYKRWYVRGEILTAKYHIDTAATANGGQDIFKPLQAAEQENVTISTSLLWWDVRAAYIINPATNLRLEAGFTFRKETGAGNTFNDRIFMVGLRGSFRSIIYDF